MRLFQKQRSKLSADKRPTFGIGMIIMKRNLHELLQMINFAKNIGADYLSVTRMIVHAEEMEKESLDLCKEEVNLKLREAIDHAKKMQFNLILPDFSVIENQSSENNKPESTVSRNSFVKQLKRCPFLWDRVYIDISAKIVPCCEPSHPIVGDIKTQDFEDIWNNEIYQRMRKTFVSSTTYKLCYDCATRGYLSQITQF